METTLPCRLLVRFDHSQTGYSTDCRESLSNCCLYFLRNAFGVTFNLSTAQTEKAKSIASRIFAALLALTLCLPFTIVGALLCKSSDSHFEKYSAVMVTKVELCKRDALPPPANADSPSLPPGSPQREGISRTIPGQNVVGEAPHTPMRSGNSASNCASPPSPDEPTHSSNSDTPFYTPQLPGGKPPPSPSSLKPYKPPEGEASPGKSEI